MLIDMNSIPLAAAVAAEAVSWLLFAVAALRFLPARFRVKIPFAVVGTMLLVHAMTGLQRVPYRIVALIAIGVSWSMITSFTLMRHQWRRYIEAQERFGRGSDEARKFANPVAFGLLGIAVAFMVIFALVFKGAGF